MTNHHTHNFSRHAILIWLNHREVGVNLEKMHLKCKKLNLRALGALGLCPGIWLALYQLECESCNCNAREYIGIYQFI